MRGGKQKGFFHRCPLALNGVIFEWGMRSRLEAAFEKYPLKTLTMTERSVTEEPMWIRIQSILEFLQRTNCSNLFHAGVP